MRETSLTRLLSCVQKGHLAGACACKYRNCIFAGLQKCMCMCAFVFLIYLHLSAFALLKVCSRRHYSAAEGVEMQICSPTNMPIHLAPRIRAYLAIQKCPKCTCRPRQYSGNCAFLRWKCTLTGRCRRVLSVCDPSASDHPREVYRHLQRRICGHLQTLACGESAGSGFWLQGRRAW